MMLEAVWFKNGKEIYWVDPVLDTRGGDKIDSISVYNGYYWYSSEDCWEEPDDFVIRTKKEN
jgi:hypothetical protein